MLNQLQVKAAHLCKTTGEQQQCQILANLCVLNFYKYDSDVCKFYLELLQEAGREQTQISKDFYFDDGFKEGLPWIYYQTGNDPRKASEVIQMSNRVKFRASIGEIEKLGYLSSLKFKIAEYDIYGNFVRFEQLND